MVKPVKNNKIYVISLGCAKNRFDMEASLADFITNGYEIIDNAGFYTCIAANTRISYYF